VVNRASISKQITNSGGRKKMAERRRRRTKAQKAVDLLKAARKTQVADKPNKVVTLSPDPKVKDKVPMSRTQKTLKKAVTAAKKEDAARVAAKPKRTVIKPKGPSKAEADKAAKQQSRTKKTLIGLGTLGAIGTAGYFAGRGKGGGSYSIKSGDTLSQIAKKQGTTLKALLAANPGIKDPNKIRVGQKIKLGSPVKNRKSVYQGMTKKQMSDMAMPKKGGGTVKRKGGGKVMNGSQLVASLYD
jgi:nucleoid-associated protein YgaU